MSSHPIQPQKNSRLALWMFLIVIGMFGFGFALVPLYNVFCQVAGVNQVTSDAVKADSALVFQPDLSRQLSFEMITSINGNAPFLFEAEKAKIKIHPGEYHTVVFRAKNLTDQARVIRAVYSVDPGYIGEYLKKTECFCFTEQWFGPGEEKAMPVRFVVDPRLPDNIHDMTLSYTLFDVTAKMKKSEN